MKKVLFCAGFMSLVWAPAANADLINFDDVAAGTAITSHYAGVTFTNGLDGSDIFAMAVANPANTTNGVSVFGTGENPFFGTSVGDFNAQFGAVDATFATAQGRVSVDVSGLLNSGDLLGNSPLHPFMEVYSGNTLLTTLYYQPAPGGLSSGEVGAYETLSFTSATDNITRVRLSSQFDGTGSSGPVPFAEFDNLSFDARLASGQFPSTGVINPTPGGDGGGGGTPVPEPATLTLLAVGLAAPFATKRKRQSLGH
ncbi:MAG TPA: PEP-CTERM sorting domain-containing protein [Vicinamibacterales bacterium]|nr:PEP-CTERM sorting domain-containing protein [Vicinamibacterales bacterium]